MNKYIVIVHLVNIYQRGSIAKIIESLSGAANAEYLHRVVALQPESKPHGGELSISPLVVGSRYKFSAIVSAIQDAAGGAPFIIHAHMGWATFIAPLLSASMKVPVVITFHNEVMHYSVGIRLGLRVFNRILKTSRSKVAYTAVSQAVALQWGEYLQRDVSVVYNPLLLPLAPATDLSSPNKCLRLVTVSRLTGTKNLKFALSVVSALDAKGVECSYTIVGDGPECESLKANVQSMGLSEKVTFVGYQSDVVPFVDEADIFLVTSFAEGFCMAAVEAMARGCLVMTHSGLPALLEFVKDRDNGIVMPKLAAEEWAQILEVVSRETILRHKWRLNAIESASIFSPESMKNGYQIVYQEVIQ